MKKIGILSMQCVVNYGSFLQAYALQKTIELLGYKTSFLDIDNGIQLMLDDNIPADDYLTGKVSLFKKIDHVLFVIIRNIYFKKNLIPKYFKVDKQDIDKIVIGSDEVFNCCQSSPWGFSRQLFGDTYVPSFSYAGSFGFTTYEMLCHYAINQDVGNSLKKMLYISVRDENSRHCVQQLTGIFPEKHLDPVLIYDWDRVTKHKKLPFRYVLIYSYDNRIVDADIIAAIRKFAKKIGAKVISVGVYQRWCDMNLLCSPFELLGYFDQSLFVITDTFHGSVISIKRNKTFCTIVKKTNYNKLVDLLEQFGLKDRIAYGPEDIQKVLSKDIDYLPVNHIIEDEIKRSCIYLQKALNQ